ncbi:filamentous hemagglutinin [Sporomusaceae bacterium BoRhaA]|uniref:hemagglutinin repeat-containing protein n=1 Tax=Pelorhabdus rhamnosifermentans TaxID=2772457 RepID=UPI001C06389A|nr:hemagglutinin repeat-containing protein [Pelorhabdus rhamnosifermentans]MBU2703252.1 filamentous hemagglutinin [Pelorhabdus rhamnosifermentans]
MNSTGTLGAGVKADGSLGTTGDLTVTATTGDIDTNGILQSQNTITLSARNLKNQGGKINAAGNLDIKLTSNLQNDQGSAYAGKNMSVSAANMNNTGTVAAANDMNLNAQNIVSTGTLGAGIQADGQLGLAGNLSLIVQNKLAATGKNLVAGNMTMNAGNIDLKGASTYIGKQGTITATVGDIDHTSGILQSQGAISLTAKDLKNQGGKITAAGNLDMKLTGSLQNDQGMAYSGKALNVSAININNSGTLAAGNDMNLNAQNIVSIGTLGAGVQADGQLGSTGNLNLIAQNNLAANGKNLAAGDMTINAGNIDLKGASTYIGKQGTITAAMGDIDHTNGTLQSQGAISLTARDIKNQGGKITAAGNLDMKLIGSLQNGQGMAYSGKVLNVSAIKINNSGTLAAGNDMNLNAQNIVSIGTLGAGVQADGQLGSTGNLNLIAQNNLAVNGKNLAAGDMTINAGNIDLQGASTYIGKQGTIAAIAGDIDHTNGILQSQGAISLTARDLKNQGGKINTNDNLDIKLTGNLQNDQGMAYSGKTSTIGASAINNTGTLAAGNDMNLNAQDIVSTGTLGAGIQADGQLGSAGNLSLTAQNNLVANGKNLAAGNMTMNAGNVDLKGASTYIGKQGTITATSGDLDHTNGILQSQGAISLTAKDLKNQGGKINAAGNLELNLSGTLQNDQGLAYSGKDLSVSAINISNTGTLAAGNDMNLNARNIVSTGTLGAGIQADGQLGTAGNLNLTAQNNLAANGKNLAAGNMTMNAGKNVDLQGASTYIGKQGTIAAKSGDVDHTNGILQSQGAISLTARDLKNQGGKINTNDNLDINLSGNLQNDQGLAYSGKALNVSAININNNGTLAAANDMNLNAQNIVSTGTLGAGIQADGQLGSAGNLNLIAQNNLAANGKNLAAGNMTMNAGNVDLQGASTYIGKQGTITAAAGDIDHTNGILQSQNAIRLTARNLKNQGGKINTNDNLEINLSGNLQNDQGLAYAGKNLSASAANISNTGTLAAGNDMNLNAQSIASTGTLGAGVQADGQLGTAGNLSLTVQNNLAANGKNLAAGNMTMNAGNIDLQGASTYIGKQGTIAATSGDIDHTNGILQSVDAISLMARNLKNQGGKITVAGNLDMKLTGSLQNDQGMAYSGKSLNVNAANISNTGTLAAANDMNLNAQGIASTGTLGAGIQADGQLGTAGNLSLITQNNLAANGKNLAAGNMTMNAGNIDLQGASTYIGKQGILTATTGDIDHTNGTLQSGDAISLTARDLKNQGGKINAVGNLDLNLRGNLQNDQGLTYSGKNLSVSAANISNTGTLAAANDMNLNAQGIASTGTLGAGIQADGQLGSTGNLSLITQNNLAANGKNLAAGDMTMTAGSVDLQGASTYIGKQGTITATAGDIDHTNGILQSKDAISLTAGNLKNQGGKINAAGNFDINLSGTLENEGSLIYSGKNLKISANRIENMNTQSANQGIEAQAIQMDSVNIENAQGSLRAADSLNLNAQQNINNEKGIISAGTILSLQDQSLSNKKLFINNTQGLLIAGQQLQINSAGLSGDGKILSQGDMDVKLTQDYTNTGEFQAQGNASLYSAGTFTNLAEIVAGNQLTIHAANIHNNANGKLNGQNTKVTADQVLNNEGLIDGNETRIQADNLMNSGMGRIYGNHLAIQANTITNRATESAAPILAAREQLDMAAKTINNQEHAKIFSVGDIHIGGSLDSKNQAVGQASILQNNSAEIESLGNLYLAVQKIYNTNEHFSTAIQTKKIENVTEYQGSGAPNRYVAGTPGVEIFNDESDHLRTPDGGYENWTAYRYKKITAESQIVNSDPASLKSGGNLSIQADILNNDKSTIIAGGSILGSVGSLNNIEGSGQRITTETGRATSYWRDHHSGRDSTGSSSSTYNPAPRVETISVSATVYQERVTPTESGTQIDKQNVNITDKGNIQSNVNVGDKESVNSNVNVGDKGTVNSNVNITDKGTIASHANVGDKGTIASNVNVGDKETVNSNVNITDKGNIQSKANVGDQGTIAPNINVGDKGTVNSNVNIADKGTIASHTNVGDKGTIPSNVNVTDQGTIKGTISPIIQMVTQNGGTVSTGAVDSRIPNSSLFSITPASNSKYLIETDPQFADYRTWTSSDYMLKQLNNDPSILQKRLGDGFYEQTMIRNQVASLTGNRFLSGYNSDEAQYQALMNNALAFAKENHLQVGQELSAEQMANLKADMVWMVEKYVVLPNGQVTQALVPQVYVHKDKDHADSPSAEGLISGSAVNLAIKGDLTNSGTIQGNTTTNIAAENIQNLGGNISGDNVNIKANVDLNNMGGQIQGIDSLSLDAGRNITIASTTSTQTNQQGSRTNLNSVAGLSVTGEQGKLTINAGQNVNLAAAKIDNSGKDSLTTISAGQNLNLSTVKESESNKIVWDNDNHRTDSTILDVGTTIQTPGAVHLQAGLDINAKAATIESNKGIQLEAGRDINLTAGELNQTVDEAHKHKGHTGGFSSLTITTRDTLDQTTAQATTLSGDSISIQAGRNLGVNGSTVVGTNDVNLGAKENIAITAAQETKTEEHMRQEKRSGILGSGFGFTIGTETQKNTLDGVNLTQAQSTVGSVQGNVTIQAGKDVKIQASDVISGQNTKIIGENVNIEAGTENLREKQSYEYQKSGLTVSLSSPAIDTIPSITNDVKRAKEVSDSRLSALYDVKAVQELKGLDQKIDNTVNGPVVGKDKDGNIVRGSKDISVNIGLGSTSMKQNSTSEAIQAKGSQITAGKNIDVIATGSNQGDGNVVIEGSTVNGDTIHIQAAKDVTIESAENRTINNTQSDGKSSGIGVKVSAQGAGFYVEGSKNQGSENGTTVSHTQSVITAKDTLKIESGKDTNILGSKVNGDRVEIKAGKDLNIASQQDSDNYNSKNQNSGISISSGPLGNITGSAGKGKIDSNYTSVTEQAGIYAGKNGFDINVGKNTDLKGAVIASDATPDKNKISTDTLTHSDIQNKADYSASSSGVGYSNKTGITPNPGIPVSGKADSTTKSAISPGTIDIRSNPNQDLSNLSRNTDQALNVLGKIFDKETVKERQELVNLFSQEANKAIGDYAESMWKNAKTPEEKANWAEGGEYKALLHAVSAGIVSSMAGTGFASGAAGDGLSQLLQKQLANIKDQNVRLIASAAIGAAAAKVVGGNAQAGASAAFNGVKHNDYIHHPTYEGAYIFVEGQGFFQVINGVDTYMQDAVPPAGAVVWSQDSNNPNYGSEYVKGDGVNSADTYLKWKPEVSGRVALDEDTGNAITINGEQVIHPSDLQTQQQAQEDVTGLAGGVKIVKEAEGATQAIGQVIEEASSAWTKVEPSTLRNIGVPAENSGIRAVQGNAEDAYNFFKAQVDPNSIQEVKPGVFVGQDANGITFTYRASSKSGPPTVDVNGADGIRKIKFLESGE